METISGPRRKEGAQLRNKEKKFSEGPKEDGFSTFVRPQKM